MRAIVLSQGKIAPVDDADFDTINSVRWYAAHVGRTWYAQRGVKEGGKLRTEYMHRVLLAAPPGLHVDHIDHDGLNNQRSNIRLATIQQNQMNTLKQRGTYSSAFKGVYQDGNRGWKAAIQHNERSIYLGKFSTPEEAHQAYVAAAKNIFGAFACEGG